MNRHEDRDDDYREEDKPKKKGHWEYAGPGYIRMDDTEETK
jgi:hypothetical protein